MLGFGKVFIAIWDNDPEGRQNYEKARKLFGQAESERFDLLPSGGSKKRRMEEMFEKDDLEMMKQTIGLPAESNYETILATAYYSSKPKKKKLLANLTSSGRSNFEILKRIIEKRISMAAKLME
jgi:hypothetical protein